MMFKESWIISQFYEGNIAFNVYQREYLVNKLTQLGILRA